MPALAFVFRAVLPSEGRTGAPEASVECRDPQARTRSRIVVAHEDAKKESVEKRVLRVVHARIRAVQLPLGLHVGAMDCSSARHALV